MAVSSAARPAWFAGLRTRLLGPPPGPLPERVRAAIRREQEDSEILVSLLQAIAIVTFTALYLLSPKAFPPGVPFEPVPVALGVYALFTLGRLVLALRRRLSAWFLTVSVVVDVAVLMVTIWSFHLQYGQPASIYLKAPTLMYVFILIALRALRFEPRYVLLTGASAALGWLALLGFALWATPDVGRTHSFATYAMSYDILLGAEFDKIVSILMVTLVLALALHRARAMLARAVREQQAAAGLARFFAPEVAGRIARAEMDLAPGDAEQRDAAILFIDLRGFTRAAELLPPSAVMALLADYQARMVGAIRAAGGSVDKYLGDGILASFGATRASTVAAADGCRALEGVLAAAEAWGADRAAAGQPPLMIGAALTAGTVMFGTVGDAARLEYTVIGDAVNLAAKLEKHCKVERAAAVLPQATLRLAERQGFRAERRWEARSARPVAGIEAPLDLVVHPAA